MFMDTTKTTMIGRGLLALVIDSIREGEAPAEPPSDRGSAGASRSRNERLNFAHAWHNTGGKIGRVD